MNIYNYKYLQTINVVILLVGVKFVWDAFNWLICGHMIFYTFCCSLPENILPLTPTSGSLTQKYIHFIQSTFTSIDTQPFASKGIL